MCSGWGEWSRSCSQECGACGSHVRSRTCPAYARDCERAAKRSCNPGPCPGHLRWLGANGEFHLLLNGCCVGKLESGGVCGGLGDRLGKLLSSFGLGGGGNSAGANSGSSGGLLGILSKFTG